MPFEDYLDGFLRQIKRQHTGSIATQNAYYRDVMRFLNYLEEQKVARLSDVDKSMMLSYLQDLKSGKLGTKPLSQASYSRNLSALKSFFAYLNQYTSISNNPIYMLHGQRYKRKLPDILSFTQMEKMLDSFDVTKPVGLRDRCIVELMYACGLRVSECANVKVKDLDLKQNMVLIFGKESKERWVPMYGRCKELLEAYLTYVRPQWVLQISDDYLFLNQKGKGISARSIQLIVEKAGVDAGLYMHVHPHMIRHSFASHMLEEGMDLRLVQTLLGHASIATTQIYTHVSHAQLKKTIEAAHPHGKNAKK